MAETSNKQPNEEEKQSQPTSPFQQRVVTFDDISGGTSEVVIEHAGQRYLLRATRNGRLLLNK